MPRRRNKKTRGGFMGFFEGDSTNVNGTGNNNGYFSNWFGSKKPEQSQTTTYQPQPIQQYQPPYNGGKRKRTKRHRGGSVANYSPTNVASNALAYSGGKRTRRRRRH